LVILIPGTIIDKASSDKAGNQLAEGVKCVLVTGTQRLRTAKPPAQWQEQRSKQKMQSDNSLRTLTE
jgi:hypothetical protein